MSGEFNMYVRFQTLLHAALEAKPRWGRNELKQLVSDVLLRVADEEVDGLRKTLAAPGSAVLVRSTLNPVADEPNVPW